MKRLKIIKNLVTFYKKKIKNLKIKKLQNKSLLSNVVATEASIIAKDLKIRKIIYDFQTKCAYNPPKNSEEVFWMEETSPV